MKYLISILTFLTITFNGEILAQTEIPFGPENVLGKSDISLPDDVHAADINGDGNIDIISASRGENKIAWFPNNGDGIWGEQQVIVTYPEMETSQFGSNFKIYAADLNEDGNVDVISTSEEDNTIAWYENLGDGRFSSPNILTSEASEPNDLFVADLTNNGSLDVIFTDNDEAGWFENESGTFSEKKTISSDIESPNAVYAADLNGDGNKDVMTANSSYDLASWIENEGDGSFGEVHNFSFGSYSSADHGVDIIAADFDADDDIDVAILRNYYSNAQSDAIIYQENDGDGNFDYETIYYGFNSPNDAVAADVNGDGLKDIVASSESGQRVILNEVDGGFADASSFGDGGEGDGVSATDLNDNGNEEVIVAEAESEKVTTFEFQESDLLQKNVIAESNNVGIQDISSTDFYDDGDVDILIASESQNKIAMYENTGNAEFAAQQVLVDSAEDASAVKVADLDNDGLKDIIASFSYGIDEIVVWYKNLGDGEIEEQTILNSEISEPDNIIAVDLNDDDYLDIITSASFDDKLAVQLNNGDGTFSEPEIRGNDSDNISSSYAADINNDGHPDLLIAYDGYPGDIVWFENQGDGTFPETGEKFFEIDDAEHIAAEDLNGNGYQDVILLTARDGTYRFENDGEGNLTEEELFVSEYSDLITVDINNDEEVDLLFSPQDVSLNQGEGEFGGFQDQIELLQSEVSISEFDVADLDGDGDLEIITASFSESTLSWYNNYLQESEGNQAPEASDVEYSVSSGSTLNIEAPGVLENDSDPEGDDLLAYLVTDAENGEMELNEDGSFTYTPESDFTGTDSLQYESTDVISSDTAWVRIEVTTGTGITENGMPESFELSQNYPNPFNPTTNIQYAVPEAAEVTLEVYNSIGKKVGTLVNSQKSAGNYTVTFDASALPSGMYFYRMEAGSYTETQKMMLIK